MNPMEKLENDHEATRSAAARDEYIRWRMMDLPPIYCGMMPPSYNTRILRMAEQTIRAMYKRDQKLALSPWRPVGPKPVLLDSSDMPSNEMLTLTIEERVVGFPGVVKPGFHDHPEVNEWAEKCTQTAEAKAWKKVEEAKRAHKAASAAVNVNATSENFDRSKEAELRTASEQAWADVKKAEAEFERLRENPLEGLKIVE